MTPGTSPQRRSPPAVREPSGSRALRESFVESAIVRVVTAGRGSRRGERPVMLAQPALWTAARPGNHRPMASDAELRVIFGVLHLVALVLGGALFLMFIRSDGASSWPGDDEDDSGGGGNDRISDKPKTSPSGGIPLPHAVQSDHRLRSGHDKLADPGRRRVRTRKTIEPARPARRRVTN